MKHILAPLLAMTLASPPHSAEPAAPADNDARMAWWREARFGMFVHWGLYSGLAGTWNGEPVLGGGLEWIQNRVNADTHEYARAAIPKFRPAADFAREWARLAKRAGCRYVVFTTKHHDGFALHDSASPRMTQATSSTATWSAKSPRRCVPRGCASGSTTR